jgi:hypothetical protein
LRRFARIDVLDDYPQFAAKQYNRPSPLLVTKKVLAAPCAGCAAVRSDNIAAITPKHRDETSLAKLDIQSSDLLLIRPLILADWSDINHREESYSGSAKPK